MIHTHKVVVSRNFGTCSEGNVLFGLVEITFGEAVIDEHVLVPRRVLMFYLIIARKIMIQNCSLKIFIIFF